MPPPDNGNEYLPFRKLIALERINPLTYRSIALAFGPASGNRTYGGHVFMQACYAAAQTVKKEYVLHNVTGWFLSAGKANERFIYTVRVLRDGGYCTRSVDVMQESSRDICFTCTCSFKKPESANAVNLNASQSISLTEKFGAALQGKRPHDHEEMPGIDTPWYWEFIRRHNGYTEPFPGLNLRKVNMDAYKHVPPLERRHLKYYSVIGDMPSWEEDANMHACAHLYASDRNSLFVISNYLGVGDNYSSIASLAHTVIFHGNAEEMNMIDPATGQARWFCQEAWAGGSRHGRGMHESRMWREDGLHVASTVQDGMLRVRTEWSKGKTGFSPDGMIEGMERRKALGKL